MAAGAAAPPNPRLTGTPFLTTWDSKDFGASSVSYFAVQHPQTGLVYVGNSFGLLEFDGATWRLIELPGDSGATVVLIDTQGTIWAGSTNTLAVLQPDAHGELQAVDVTARLPTAEGRFGRLYLGAVSPEGVYFASPTHLIYLGHDGTTRVWRPGTIHFNGLCWFDGALHVSRGEMGLARLERGAFVAVAPPPRSPLPAIKDTLRLFGARREAGAREALLLTDVGPMRWAGPGQPMEPLPAGVPGIFKQDSAIAATFLRDGRLAFSLRRQGLLILDAAGAFSTLINPARGLPRGQIQGLAADDQGGLWLAQVNGVSRLQFESRFVTQASLDAARDFLRHGDRLYISHDTGVAWRDDDTGELHPVSGFPNAPTTLFAAGGRVFGTGQYLREITPDDRAVVALPVQLNGLTPLPRQPGTFVGASVRGLRILNFDGERWSDAGRVSGVDESVSSVLADDDGYVWAAGYAGAISWRVDFRGGAQLNARVKIFDAAAGLPLPLGSDPRWFSQLGDQLVAVRDGQLLRYDRSAERFVRDDRVDYADTLARLFIGPGGAGEQWWFFQSPAPPAAHVLHTVFQTPSPHIAHVVRTAEDRWRAELVPASTLAGVRGTGLYYDRPTRTLWIGDRGPPITMDADWRPPGAAPPFRAVIRGLSTAAGEVLLRKSTPNPAPPRGTPALRLAPEQNSIRLAFASPRFTPDHRGTLRTVYRTRLEGVERDWSGWSPTPWREFTDLPYRDFTFHVQARDLEGLESSVDTLGFAIAPPWWLARAALAGYALLGLVALGGIFRLRTRALHRRNEQLESIVTARTAELERLRRLEMDEKISARLAEEKARLEVLRYQLNPHFLFNTLNSIYTLVWSHSRPAGNLVRRLAEFCRMTLTRRSAETATLAEEIAMIRAYLELEQIRWQENLQVEISLAPEIAAVPLPPFLLLPLVENAVKYGSHTSPDLLRVRVSAQNDGADAVVIEVANSGTWVEPGSMPQIASTGIGLENLRQRLARYYPGAHAFTTQAADGWVVTRLRLALSLAAAAVPGQPAAE